jgi:hypothetical protein
MGKRAGSVAHQNTLGRAASGKKNPMNGIDGLYISGAQTGANRKRFADFALKSRSPTTSPVREFVDVGGLMYYGADLADSYRRVATYIDRILKGNGQRNSSW